MEVDDRGVHTLYKQVVGSGHAFGAKRWVATLDRQCERLASAMATNIPTVDVGGNLYLIILFFGENIIYFPGLKVEVMNIISDNKPRREKEYVETS